MEQAVLQQTVQYLKVMAHESRLRLLGILADGEQSVGELAVLLTLKEPTVSHHLGKLRELDLVRMRTEGTTHFYSLNSETLQQINRSLVTPERVAQIGAEVTSDAWEQKVLQTFLDGERLTKIPDTRKKRTVILKWLVTQFAYDTHYSEKEVNAIIKRHHDDAATLRRELIGAKLMQRAQGEYWRIDQVEQRPAME